MALFIVLERHRDRERESESEQERKREKDKDREKERHFIRIYEKKSLLKTFILTLFQAPSGKKLEIKVVNTSGVQVCTSGCTYNGLEVKAASDQKSTGIRLAGNYLINDSPLERERDRDIERERKRERERERERVHRAIYTFYCLVNLNN